MRKYALAIFVKTPTISSVKTRLAADIGKEEAEEFFVLSAAALHETVKTLQSLHPNIKSFWAIAESEGLDHSLWQDLPRIYQGDGKLGERLHKVFDQLIDDFDGVVIIGADSPQIGSDDLAVAFEVFDDSIGQDGFDIVVGPAKDGGFYLVGSSKRLPSTLWASVRYGTEQAGRDLIDNALKLGDVFTLPEEIDIDTVGDLRTLSTILPERSEDSPAHLALLEWLNSRSYLGSAAVVKSFTSLAK